MRLTAGKILQLDHGQRFIDSLANLVLRALFHLQAIGHVVEHRHVGKQRVMLEYGIEGTIFRGSVGEILSRQGDAALIGMFETGHQPQQGGFSAPGRAQQGNELAVVDLKIQTVEHRFATELLGKIAQG